MATVIATPSVAEIHGGFPTTWTIGDLQRHLGGIPIERIRLFPHPGSATIEDLERQLAQNDRLLELIDGVLVEKTRGYYESLLAIILIRRIGSYLDKHDLGILLGSDGTLRVLPTQVRAPDVSFLSWRHFPDRKLPRVAFPPIAPDLAIEILSLSNTTDEMNKKREGYFRGGTKLVWCVDPDPKTVAVYHSVENPLVLTVDNELDGEDILPGFKFSVRELFALAGERE